MLQISGYRGLRVANLLQVLFGLHITGILPLWCGESLRPAMRLALCAALSNVTIASTTF